MYYELVSSISSGDTKKDYAMDVVYIRNPNENAPPGDERLVYRGFDVDSLNTLNRFYPQWDRLPVLNLSESTAFIRKSESLLRTAKLILRELRAHYVPHL